MSDGAIMGRIMPNLVAALGALFAGMQDGSTPGVAYLRKPAHKWGRLSRLWAEACTWWASGGAPPPSRPDSRECRHPTSPAG